MRQHVHALSHILESVALEMRLTHARLQCMLRHSRHGSLHAISWLKR